ncbi:MAG: CBM9 family sugar-binding protein, partial [Candidatus Bathyarchaeota archaeon]
MCRKLIYLTSFVSVLSLISSVPAQDTADVLIRYPYTSIPVLDGVVDEVWSFSTEQSIDVHISADPPRGAADCSGAWRALWDWEYLYVLVEVKDEMLHHDSTYNRSWEDDSVEVYVDGDNSKRISVDENDHQYCFRWNTQVETPRAHHHGEPSLEGVEYAVDTTGNGYLFEIRLPWVSMMGKQPTAGQLIGIDVFINDDDDGGSRDTQISWHATDGTGWNTPSMWGTALLIADKRAVYHVDANATGNDDGSSWADAYVYLQDALADANDAQKPVEIHVAQGTYTPDCGNGYVRGDKQAKFLLKSGVTIKGGFAGVGADDPNAWDHQTYITVLSGDLSGNDERLLENFIENSDHVIWCIEGNAS